MKKIHPLLQPFIRERKPWLTLVIFTGVASSFFMVLIPVFIGNFFAIRYGNTGSKGRLLHMLGLQVDSLNIFFLVFLALLIARVIAGVFEKWLSLREGEILVKQIREKLFSDQLHTSPEIFAGKPYGNYLLRYSNDMKSVKDYLLRGRLAAWKYSLFLLTGFSLLAMIHWPLTLILASGTGICFGVMYGLYQYQKKWISQSRNKRSNLLAFVTKSFSRHNRIQTENKADKTIDRFNNRSAQLFTANMQNNRWETITENLIPALQYGVILVILASSVMFKPAIPYNDALVFILVSLMMMSAIRNLFKVPGYLNKGRISLDKINELVISRYDEPITPLPETGNNTRININPQAAL